MPAHLVREAVEKYGKGKPIDEALVEKLADRELFFVSEQALTIRLERLGLLSSRIVISLGHRRIWKRQFVC